MCDACPPTVAAPSADAFAENLLEMLNHAGISMMISIGHRTGLFETMSELHTATAEDIATKASLSERYVREWLGAMVTGRIVMYDADNKTYVLPDEHARFLTRTPDNVASTMQWISVLGQVEDQLVDCFRAGGGVPYSEYSRFHEVMAEESAQTVVAALTEHILPLVPELVADLETGIDVLDVGCGSGLAMILLAEVYPNSRFAGYDFSEEAVDWAITEAKRRGVTNVRFDVRDAAQLGEKARYDLITAFDSIHDQSTPDVVLSEIAGALREDGTFLMQDIAASTYLQNNLEHPIAPFLYTISTMHCMTVSLAQGGAGLGTCWGEELATQMLDEAGFRTVNIERLPHDIMNSYYIACKAVRIA